MVVSRKAEDNHAYSASSNVKTHGGYFSSIHGSPPLTSLRNDIVLSIRSGAPPSNALG